MEANFPKTCLLGGSISVPTDPPTALFFLKFKGKFDQCLEDSKEEDEEDGEEVDRMSTMTGLSEFRLGGETYRGWSSSIKSSLRGTSSRSTSLPSLE